MNKIITALGVVAIGAISFSAAPSLAYETDDYGFLIERPQTSRAAYCPPARAYRAPAQSFLRTFVSSPTVIRSEVRSSPVVARRATAPMSIIVSQTPAPKPTLATSPTTKPQAKTSALPTAQNPRR